MKIRQSEEIVAAARQRAGLEEFASESFRDGLALLVHDINRHDRFTAEGAARFEDKAISDLANRLKVDDYIRRHPEVLQTPIKRPLVVLGLPRTGSTLLNNLLSLDPRHRSPLLWEFDNPIPPATSEELIDGPRARAALKAEEAARAANPDAPRFRPVSAIFPIECVYIHAQDFKSLSLESISPMPAYAEWMLHCDMTSAYEHHRRVLQVMQSKAPGTWNLKMPSHALHIRWLLKAYPDARIIWTHRDPYSATASLFSLIAMSHTRHMGEADRAFIAASYPGQLRAHVQRMMDMAGSLPDNQLFHHSYADIVRNPIEAVRKIYDWLGEELTPEAEARMARWLEENPQKKWVTHSYRLEEFGMTVEKLKPYFADYLASFDIESEAAA